MAVRSITRAQVVAAWDADVVDESRSPGEVVAALGIPHDVATELGETVLLYLAANGHVPSHETAGVAMKVLSLGISLGYHLWSPDGAGALTAAVDS